MVRKNMLLFVMLLFIITFSWEMFFTSGLDFFFEDFGAFHLDKQEYPLKLKLL